MKNITSIIAILCIVSIAAAFPHIVRAQQEQPHETSPDILAITAEAEKGIMNALPQGVKDFFAKTFRGVEVFRVHQVTTATAQRDAFKVQLDAAQANRDQATDDNGDAVEEGTSPTLYSNMGDRVTKGAPATLFVKYYAYKYYVAFVASPILFYLVGSFIIVYIIGTVINRSRKRGE